MTPQPPSGATPASLARWPLALELAAACPDPLFEQIALTGSTARGTATDASDLDVNLWGLHLPASEARRAWLMRAGVSHLPAEPERRQDGSEWLSGWYQGVPVEIGWQTWDDLDASLHLLLTAQVMDSKHLWLANLILDAVPLRGQGRLQAWQQKLRSALK